MTHEIIGRDAELSSLARLFDAVQDGPAALVLAGQAGIGKTTLWQEAISLASQRSFRVLACRPAGAESGLSYSALGDLLEPVLDDTLRDIPEPRRHALEVALLRVTPTGRAPDQRAVGRAALDVLCRASADRPVIVAIDDVQWLDKPSARVLGFVARRLETEPVGILAAIRSDDEGPVPLGLDRAFGEARVTRLSLRPMSLAAIHQLLLSRLDVAFPRHTLVRLHETSGGNPFFALELGRALLRRGEPSFSGPELPIPDSVRGVVADRLGTLSDSTREVLLIASALSQPTVALIERTMDGVVVRPSMDEAIDAGVIELASERVYFTHPLLASVLLSEPSSGDRRRLHHRLAEVVPDAEERARHLALGAEGPDERIASALDEASAHALARAAPDAAADLSEQAWHMTPPDRPTDRGRRVLEAIDHHFAAGDMARAQQLAEEVLPDAPAGPYRAHLLFRLGVISGRIESFRTSQTLLEEALSEVGNDIRLRIEVEQELAFLSVLVSGNLANSLAHAQVSVSLAEELGDPRLLATSLVGYAGYEFSRGAGIREDLYRRAAEIQGSPPSAASHTLPYLTASVGWGIVLKWADDFDGARAKFEQGYRDAVDSGDESAQPFVLYHLSELECWAGNLSLAGRYAADAMKIARQGDQQAMLTATLHAAGLVDACLGRIDSARSIAEEALETSQRTGNLAVGVMSHGVLGFLELSLDNFEAAHEHLGGLASAMASMGSGEPGVVRFLADAIEAEVGIGDLESATMLVDHLQERGKTLDRPWALATGARCRALVQAAAGDVDAAEASIEEALREHARLPVPLELGRTFLAQGVIRRRARQKRAAKESLERAVEIFEGLGATLWTDKARAELRRLGQRASSPLGLTPTEERVAELVAAGRTNREVADALFMSVKTVDSHLVRIYSKLGVRSRTELARKIPEASGDHPASGGRA